uniref:(northern house mosquito) hypothetical protein n=1 Tax=Culex pipiens TaxID=7175 RepID=A0A8D8HUS8_CULPI
MVLLVPYLLTVVHISRLNLFLVFGNDVQRWLDRYRRCRHLLLAASLLRLIHHFRNHSRRFALLNLNLNDVLLARGTFGSSPNSIIRHLLDGRTTWEHIPLILPNRLLHLAFRAIIAAFHHSGGGFVSTVDHRLG